MTKKELKEKTLEVLESRHQHCVETLDNLINVIDDDCQLLKDADNDYIAPKALCEAMYKMIAKSSSSINKKLVTDFQWKLTEAGC